MKKIKLIYLFLIFGFSVTETKDITLNNDKKTMSALSFIALPFVSLTGCVGPRARHRRRIRRRVHRRTNRRIIARRLTLGGAIAYKLAYRPQAGDTLVLENNKEAKVLSIESNKATIELNNETKDIQFQAE